MLDRVDVDVVEMRGEIGFVADGVLLELPLPYALLAFGTPALAALKMLMCFEIAAGEPFLDQTPASGEVGVPHGQGPESMQVIGKDDVGIDLEGVTGADLLDGSQEQRHCRALFEQRAPVLGDELKK